MKHGLQARVGLMKPVAVHFEVVAIDIEVYRRAHSAGKPFGLTGITDLSDKAGKLVDRRLAVGQSEFAMGPQAIADKSQVQPLTSPECILNGLEEAREIRQLLAKTGDTRIDGSHGAHKSAQRRGYLSPG